MNDNDSFYERVTNLPFPWTKDSDLLIYCILTVISFLVLCVYISEHIYYMSTNRIYYFGDEF